MKFGFLNEEKAYTSEYFNIKPLPDIRTRVQKIKDSFYIEKGWIYPPYEKIVDGIPTKPWIWYDIFPSHTLEIKPFKENIPKEFSLFSILFLGFLKGMQLVPEGHGKFYRTPFETGKLTGFIVFDEDVCKIMDIAAEFYLANYNSGISKRYYSAIFWFLYGQSYIHIFEKFEAQYQVVDSIFSICCELFDTLTFEKNIRHAQRIPILCEYFGVPIPFWGTVDSKKSSIVSRLRNELVHEARFAGEPIGYNLPNENYDFQFPRLNEKLLLSIIKVRPTVFKKELSRNQYLVSLNDISYS